MKNKFAQLAAVALAAVAGAAQAQVSVGASISINEPGVYGRVDIGPQAPAYAPPALVYAQPVVIAPPPVAVRRAPIYLYVPEPYTRDWAHHCRAYNACGQPVYFVRDQWVRDRYVHFHPQDHRYDHWQEREERRDHDYGPGHDHGRGPDHRDHDRGDHDHEHGDHGRDH